MMKFFCDQTHVVIYLQIYNIHGGMQRQCLTFEMPRTKKSTKSVVFSSSFSSTMQNPLINSSGLFSLSNEELNSDSPKTKRQVYILTIFSILIAILSLHFKFEISH